MQRLKNFVATAVLGGVIIILPVVLLAAVFSWLFKFIAGLIRPLTNMVVARAGVMEFVAQVSVVVIILLVCFGVGVIVRTRFGKFLHEFVETKILKIAPGYTLIKETVLQILGNKRSPFSRVALVQLFGNETLATAFVTDEHPDGSCSVFVPTGPNPTSGNIFHLKAKYVHPVDVSVEEAMRSIISCGAGSTRLIAKYKK